MANWCFIFIALLIVPNIVSNGIKIALCSTTNPCGGDKNMLNNAKNILGGAKNIIGGVKNIIGGVKNALGGVKFGVDGIKFKFDVTINCFYKPNLF